MKIYNVKVDSNSFQWLMPQIGEDDLLNYTVFDCQHMKDNWSRDIEWYSFNPKNKKGNFFSLGNGGGFVFDKSVYDSDLLTLLEMAGEIIPIQVEGQEFYVMNVLECVNALDEKNSQWDFYDDGSRANIKEYAFYSNRLSESSIFKIPQTSRTEILTYSGIKDEDDEFIAVYNKLNFAGLIFTEIFSN